MNEVLVDSAWQNMSILMWNVDYNPMLSARDRLEEKDFNVVILTKQQIQLSRIS
jgi:hypothetical protein